MPKNPRQLTERLPKSNYGGEERISKSKRESVVAIEGGLLNQGV
jgi:hypothetical protein